MSEDLIHLLLVGVNKVCCLIFFGARLTLYNHYIKIKANF